jgi:hypothetical protein
MYNKAIYELYLFKWNQKNQIWLKSKCYRLMSLKAQVWLNSIKMFHTKNTSLPSLAKYLFLYHLICIDKCSSFSRELFMRIKLSASCRSVHSIRDIIFQHDIIVVFVFLFLTIWPFLVGWYRLICDMQAA